MPLRCDRPTAVRPVELYAHVSNRIGIALAMTLGCYTSLHQVPQVANGNCSFRCQAFLRLGGCQTKLHAPVNPSRRCNMRKLSYSSLVSNPCTTDGFRVYEPRYQSRAVCYVKSAGSDWRNLPMRGCGHFACFRPVLMYKVLGRKLRHATLHIAITSATLVSLLVRRSSVGYFISIAFVKLTQSGKQPPC